MRPLVIVDRVLLGFLKGSRDLSFHKGFQAIRKRPTYCMIFKNLLLEFSPSSPDAGSKGK